MKLQRGFNPEFTEFLHGECKDFKIMQMKKFFLLILILFGIVFTASFFVKNDYQVITADLDKKGFFPKDCYIFYQQFHYKIDRKLVYKNQLLAKDISSGSESIIVRNIDFIDLMKKDMMRSWSSLNCRPIR